MSFALIEATATAVLLRDLRLDLQQGFEPTLVLRVTLRPGGDMPMRAKRSCERGRLMARGEQQSA